MSMEVQFFWMPRYKFNENQDLLEVPNLPPDLTHREAEACLYNSQLEKVVCSGDIITLRTHDPEGFPLPEFCLLELQWILHRVTNIHGASEELSNDDYKDDSSSRIPAWFRFGRSAGVDNENRAEDDRIENRLPAWLESIGRRDDEKELEDVPELYLSSSVPPDGMLEESDVIAERANDNVIS
jgi:hypothetical protein